MTICRRSWSLIWKRSGWANGNYREFIKKGKKERGNKKGETQWTCFSHSESWKEESGSWEEYRYRDVRNFESFLAKEDKSGLVNPDVPTDFTGWDRICTGSDWKGRDLYLWLHGEMKVPAEWEGKRAVGVFDFGMTGGGNNTGFESLLFVNGEQYQAVDANHKEVFFRPEICGNEVSLTFRLWSGLEGGGLPREMEHRLKERIFRLSG